MYSLDHEGHWGLHLDETLCGHRHDALKLFRRNYG
jgi:hypothetical protein